MICAMNTPDSVEDVKPPISEQIFMLSIKESSTKVGEIFRNDNGQYSFMCFHCYVTFEDFGQISSHCESHFAYEQKYDIDAQHKEFVFCSEISEIETELDHKLSLPTPKPTSIESTVRSNQSSHTTVHSDSVDRRRRKKKKSFTTANLRKIKQPDIPQNCPVCNVWCDDFPIHIKTVHNFNGRIHQCFICKKFSKSLAALKLHMHSFVHTRAKRYQCEKCPVCNVWCDDLRIHIKTVHNFYSRMYQCFICKKFSKSLAALKIHMNSVKHTRGKCYQCEMEPPITNPSDARRHKCLFCKQWFPNHVEFKVHFKEAHGEDADYFYHKRSVRNIFTCYICEREFPLRYYLVGHMRIHDDKFLRHQCPTCGQRVRTYGQLTQHLKRHEHKILECQHCDKTFKYSERLRCHLMTHKTELDYQCEICSKSFKTKQYLTRHATVHANMKKFGCKYCPATFNFSSGRRAHEKGQHKAV